MEHAENGLPFCSDCIYWDCKVGEEPCTSCIAGITHSFKNKD